MNKINEIEEMKKDEATLHLVLSLFLKNKNIETKYRTLSIKQNGDSFYIEETRNYKLDNNFYKQNEEELKKIYRNLEKLNLI